MFVHKPNIPLSSYFCDRTFFDWLDDRSTILVVQCIICISQFLSWKPRTAFSISLLHWLTGHLFSHSHWSLVKYLHCDEQVQEVAVELLLDEQHHQPFPLLHVRVRPSHHQLQLLEVCFFWQCWSGYWRQKMMFTMFWKWLATVQDYWSTTGNGAGEGKSREGPGHHHHILCLFPSLSFPSLLCFWCVAVVPISLLSLIISSSFPPPSPCLHCHFPLSLFPL